MVEATTTRVEASRGMGRSYCPNARVASRPTIEPIAMPIIDGAIIWLRPDSIAIIGSSAGASASGAGGRASDTANSVNSGRYASSVRCAQTPVVTISSRAPTWSKPVTSRTCISTIGVRFSYAILTVGSTLPEPLAPADPASAPVAGVEAIVANCRAASQLSGPWPCRALARSPKSGRFANGPRSALSPGTSSSAMDRCYGRRDGCGCLPGAQG